MSNLTPSKPPSPAEFELLASVLPELILLMQQQDEAED